MSDAQTRIRKRIQILSDMVSGKERHVLKLRQRILEGWLPADKQELAALLQFLSSYYKQLGMLEDSKEILEKIIGGPAMEKYGVECQGKHEPTQAHMTKVGAEDYSCKFCGKTVKYASIKIEDTFNLKDDPKAKKAEQK